MGKKLFFTLTLIVLTLIITIKVANALTPIPTLILLIPLIPPTPTPTPSPTPIPTPFPTPIPTPTPTPTPTPIPTQSFLFTFGFGVADGLNVFETCTSSCQAGIDGTGNGQFSSPFGVALDSTGNIYVADTLNDRIQVFNSSRVFQFTFGHGRTDDQFNSPVGIAVDSSGNIYVANDGDNLIQVFNSSGVFQFTFSSGDGRFICPQSIACLYGIALDSRGNIYVADTGIGIQVFNSSGVFQFTFGDDTYMNSIGVALDSSGNIYVAGNNRIQVFNSSGVFQFTFGFGVADGLNEFETCTSSCQTGIPGPGNGQFGSPSGIALDSRGNIYVADTGNSRIQVFNSGGVYQSQFGTFGSGDGQFSRPFGIALDSRGNIYVADTDNHRIVVATLNAADSGTANPGGTVTVSTAPQIAGEAGVSATLNNTTGSGAAMVTVETLPSNPSTVNIFSVGGFVDLRVTGVDPTNSVAANFYYPSTVTDTTTENNLVLLYFTGSAWESVLSSGGVPPIKDTTDNLDGTVSGGRFSVTFDNTSTPKITELTGTAFTPTTLNKPPNCSAATPSVSNLWSPDHKFVPISILGVTDPDGDPVGITISSIHQDEPTTGTGSGDTCPDANGVGTNTAQIRAERSGNGDGRVYHISFTADDGKGGTCMGEVTVCVPHDQGKGSTCVDEGPHFDSTVCK